jgi:hypothetical protein
VIDEMKVGEQVGWGEHQTARAQLVISGLHMCVRANHRRVMNLHTVIQNMVQNATTLSKVAASCAWNYVPIKHRWTSSGDLTS